MKEDRAEKIKFFPCTMLTASEGCFQILLLLGESREARKKSSKGAPMGC
jgi:hypothetical protein